MMHFTEKKTHIPFVLHCQLPSNAFVITKVGEVMIVLNVDINCKLKPYMLSPNNVLMDIMLCKSPDTALYFPFILINVIAKELSRFPYDT